MEGNQALQGKGRMEKIRRNLEKASEACFVTRTDHLCDPGVNISWGLSRIDREDVKK